MSALASRSPDSTAILSKSGSASIYFDGVQGTNLVQGIPVGSHIRCGFYFRLPSIPATGTQRFLRFVTATGETVHMIRFDWDNELIELVLDSVEVGSVAFADWGIVADTWIRMGIDFSPAQFQAFYINGIAAFNNTVSVSDTDINAIMFGSFGTVESSFPFYLDDIYIDEETKGWITYPQCPPDIIFLSMTVSGPGDFAQWTPYGSAQNYQNVDDPTTPDGETTHNYVNVSSRKDTYHMTNITAPSAPGADYWRINAVIPMVVAKKYNVAQDASLAPILFDGIHTGTEDVILDIGPDYLVYWSRHEREPDGSLWSEADVNGIQVGYLSGGTFS